MSGFKIVLKLNRSKLNPQPSPGSAADVPPATIPPLSSAAPVSQPEPSGDHKKHSKKGKKDKKEKKEKKHKRSHHGAASPSADGSQRADAAAAGMHKKRTHGSSNSGVLAQPAFQQAQPSAGEAAAGTSATPAAAPAAASPAAAPPTAPPAAAAGGAEPSRAPVKLTLKAPKLLIKGAWGQPGAAGSTAAAEGAAGARQPGDPLRKKKKKKRKRLEEEVAAAIGSNAAAATVSAPAGVAVAGSEDMRERKRRRRRQAAMSSEKGGSLAGLMASAARPAASAGPSSTMGPSGSGPASPISTQPHQEVDGKPAAAAGATSRRNLERVIDKLQKKDPHKIFSKPVTEEEAPGYAAIIARPMDFSTIRKKLEAGEYDGEKAWADLQQDMETMFTNAMTYNPAESFVHKQARSLLEFSNKVIELGRQGVTDFRGRTNSIARAHNAQIAEEERAAREAARAADRAAKLAERNVKLKQRAAASGMVPAPQRMATAPAPRPYYEPEVSGMMVDDTVRMTYHVKSRDAAMADFKGLAWGANMEGLPFTAAGKLAMQPAAGQLEQSMLAARLSAFTRGLVGRANQIARSVLDHTRFAQPANGAQGATTAPAISVA